MLLDHRQHCFGIAPSVINRIVRVLGLPQVFEVLERVFDDTLVEGCVCVLWVAWISPGDR